MRLFGKPDPTTRSTLDEYNKFFRQPLKMLSAAGVLSEMRKGSKIEFYVEDLTVFDKGIIINHNKNRANLH